ncbi:hypothetical protein K7395_13010 [Streptomyces filamentosus]|uniref:DNA-binding protein n=2 Tax=Streptomyces filamentosus TaxID=67294 RepID=A0ABY4UW48_STRFL|nr:MULTISPECIES: hypothetical protein [Streptomyces]EWS93906.1 hypothetical protein SSIG_04514 [Streptomyces filamentosus NRRL 11379]MYR80905.1 hypothetical protein [Streptomyces sp. SID5466]USC47600.1 hypothetical protein K7395_13010 [Streptomyces filamentosus]
MDTQQVSAPSRAPSAGVVHINIRLTDGYTIISNRLSQHRGMSLLAIGVGTHIQSLPDGRRVGVKALAERFPESEVRIAAALRELEQHGFLRRTRVRAGGGKLATRTESYNHPEAAARGRVRAAVAAPVVPVVPAPVPAPVLVPAPVAAAVPVRVPVPEPVPVRVPVPEPVPVRVPVPEPVPALVPAPVPVEPVPGPRLVPTPTAPRKPRLPLPAPQQPTEALYAAAADLLAGLPKTAPLFLLSEEDVRGLVPGVAAWLERGARPDAVRAAITDDPPVPLRHPAKLLRHRLATLLPPPLPAAEPVVPLQNCDDCDRAFRSSVPGVCRGCGEARSGVGVGEPCLVGA